MCEALGNPPFGRYRLPQVADAGGRCEGCNCSRCEKLKSKLDRLPKQRTTYCSGVIRHSCCRTIAGAEPPAVRLIWHWCGTRATEREGSRVQRITRKLGTIAALVVVGAAFSGCSKKGNSAADTSAAAVDTTSTTSTMTASSTAPGMQDTSTVSTTTKSTTKRSTTKKAPKKASY